MTAKTLPEHHSEADTPHGDGGTGTVGDLSPDGTYRVRFDAEPTFSRRLDRHQGGDVRLRSDEPFESRTASPT